MDWSTTAFLFPGQGSQQLGMGKDIADAYPIARQTFEQADDLIGFALSRIIFDGPQDQLNDTAITQPAMYVTSMAVLRALQQELPAAQPAYAAGHSLGELTALTATGALAFEAGVPLVRDRAQAMKDAGEQHPGAMAALIGAPTDAVETLCAQIRAETGKPVVIANDNCPGQVVISGDVDALHIATERAPGIGARRVIPLAVSVATHSPLMQPAQERFAPRVQETTFHIPQVPVYANLSAQPLTDVAAIRTELEGQLTGPVRWNASMQAMLEAGARTFIEIGANNVLTGLLRRIDKSAERINIDTLDALRSFVDANKS